STRRGQTGIAPCYEYQLSSLFTMVWGINGQTSVTCQRDFLARSCGKYGNSLERNCVRSQIFLNGLNTCRCTQIPPVVAISSKRGNGMSLTSKSQVGPDYGKCSLLGQHRQQSRRDDVYAAKSVGMSLLRSADAFIVWCTCGSPSTELVLFVKKQIP